METYTEFYSLRLSEPEANKLQALAEKWDRSGAQVLRDAIAIMEIGESIYEQKHGEPARDSVQLAKEIFGHTNSPAIGPGESP